MASPFFIVGCVRSGTTMLRNLLRGVPNLVSPEETHYYRWGDPFGAPAFQNAVVKNQLMKKHREMDGVSEETFATVFEGARSRRDLYERYMAAFKEAKGMPDARWFDKTPQNIYGLAMIAHDFPDAKIVHIVRNPVNVVSSLAEGRVIALANTVAASNYWTEALSIFNAIRPVIAGRSYELSYERLTADPRPEFAKLLAFLGEDPSIEVDVSKIHPERDRYRQILKPEDIEVVREICTPWAIRYGYDLSQAVVPAA